MLVSLQPYVAGQGGGYDDVIDVGSGRAQPLGVEAVFSYDGLILNKRKWIDTYLVTQIDGLSDPDLRDAREVNPGRHGETPFDAYYGGRTIVLTGKIRAHTINKLRDMQEALRTAFSDLRSEKPLVIARYNALTGVMVECKKSAPIVMAEIQQDFTFRRDFQVTLRASNPRILSYDEQYGAWYASDTLPSNRFVETMRAYNNGNFPAEPSIRLYGPVKAPAAGARAGILRSTYSERGATDTQDFIIKAPPSSDVAVPDGYFLELNTARRTLKLVNRASMRTTNAFNLLDVSSTWIEFRPGRNVLSFMPSGASKPRVIVRYRHTYL